ncbi:MAG: hypothetical protein ICV64_03840 [Thermoleophilia bacterium]|nr:hypothetical protein [Thermoleophilia bacterium]
MGLAPGRWRGGGGRTAQQNTADTAQVQTNGADAHAAIRDGRDELRRLDLEIENQPTTGLAARLGPALRRLRRDR